MITSKEIINISEEYLMRVRDVMIYVNHTSSDYQKLYSVNSYHVIRFTADIQTKNVYVWDGLENLMHGEAAHNIGIYNSYISNKMYNTKLFMGIASVSGGKAAVTHGSDNLSLMLEVIKGNPKSAPIDQIDYLKDLVSNKWAWVNKYLDCNKFFGDIKNILNRI